MCNVQCKDGQKKYYKHLLTQSELLITELVFL